MHYLSFLGLLLITVLISCSTTQPKIKCDDLNHFSADTSYFISQDWYSGFIFSKSYKPGFELSDIRFTPTYSNVEIAEKILKQKFKYQQSYKRQYLGHINASGDSIVTIRLLKNGFKENCFDRIVAFGFGDYYEKNQRLHNINLTKKSVQ